MTVAWASLVASLPRTRFPQTTTEPASAWLRAAHAVLERQAPWVVAALAVVLGLLLAAAFRLRPHAVPGSPVEAPRSGRLAFLWTLAPWLLVAAVALPALRSRFRPPASTPAALRVEVIGHQWWWEIRYPAQGIVTATDLHVPVGEPVRFVLESADVAHSLWVPAVGPRVDVPPARRRELAFTPDREGVYPGQCAELCGASHAHMRIVLFVESQPAFAAWVAAQRAPRAEPDSGQGGALRMGEQIFVDNACRGCHTVRGLSDGPGGPDLTHFASRTTIAGGMFARSDSALAHWILNADRLKQGSAMPGLPVPASELKSLVAWLQSLK